MKIQISILFTLAALFCLGSCSKKYASEAEYDLCVYGGNASGVITAFSAVKLGRSVVLIQPTAHLGGLTTGGLSSTDIGNKFAVTGLARNFYRRMGNFYDKLEEWRLEPSKAEEVMQQYISEGKIKVIYQHQLHSVQKEGRMIRQITIQSVQQPEQTQSISARIFVDCSYEGDLLAKAGISYTIGREANNQYNETINGVQLMTGHQFEDGIDPYREKGNPASGLLWGISDSQLLPNGSGDQLMQAYNFRLCLTQDTTNQLPITRPEGYDSTKYELLLRLVQTRVEKGKENHSMYDYFLINRMPNGKSDWNHRGGFSLDMIGMNHDYPEAGYARRAEIWKDHENYIKGLLYFFGNDTRMPEFLRKELLTWGWAKDEFVDNGGFPHQLYVREARRMIGEYVMTEHNCVGQEVVSDPIALAAYTMDSHNCQRIVVEKGGMKMVKNEGNVEVGGFDPYPIAYRSITPKREECENLLVPVCLSASHIAYGSIRMEPVFMVLGQVAGIAADLALTQQKMVQEVDWQQIVQRMESDPLLDGSTPDVLVDDLDTTSIQNMGQWNKERFFMRNYKTSLQLCDSLQKDNASYQFDLPIVQNGKYRCYFYCPAFYRSPLPKPGTLSLSILHAGGTTDQLLDYATAEGGWAYLGEFEFEKNTEQFIRINGKSSSGTLVADAVLLVPARE